MREDERENKSSITKPPRGPGPGRSARPCLSPLKPEREGSRKQALRHLLQSGCLAWIMFCTFVLSLAI